ncbi:MAG: serine protease [Acidobacteriota bacterium]|nr:serine protease [Acidobacteriota bacterium]
MAQESSTDFKTPLATTWTLDAAAPQQKTAIKSVLLIACSATGLKGTGFLVRSGVIVTNHHVVAGCAAGQVVGITSSGVRVTFSGMVTDADVDLAALKPSVPLKGGLTLGTDRHPKLGTTVSTWGYPLIFNGPAPLLSVGYVAGYSEDESNGKRVKHIVVNGAFNPGNSGGPLLTEHDGRVVGVVVAKFHLYPRIVKDAIEVLAKNPSGVVYTATDANGQPKNLSEAQVVAIVLEQFYKTTQVMIGEAISVSELRRFLEANKAQLR